jgi:signal transduction histidine kinase
MEERSKDTALVLRSAAWAWMIYLVILGSVELVMDPSRISTEVGRYYLVNGSIGLLFMGFAYWSWLAKTLRSYFVPVMLVIISLVPIMTNRLFIQELPHGPLSNLEGLVIRLLPVMFLGLVITAWNYPWPVVVVYSLATTGMEVALVLIFPLPAFMTPQGIQEASQAIIVLAIVRSLSFLVVGYFIIVLVSRLRKQHAQLAAANARLVQHASTIEKLTISQERNRLARELHDTLAHTLSGLSVQLETTQAYWEVDPEKVSQLLDQSLAATKAGLSETRRALKALRASPLEDLGLLLALGKLARSVASRGNLQLSIHMPDRLPGLSLDVEQTIYRVAQEALENIVYHANAKNVVFQLMTSGHDLILSIEDDGIGFDPRREIANGHFGLSGMQERAQVAGGKLQIHSHPDKGTRIQLVFEGLMK